MDCELFGADGVTIHPRPDERHIRYADARNLKPVLKTEFNIEGNPLETKFVDLVMELCPHQVTLVPDAREQLTSNHGWDTVEHAVYLKKITQQFRQNGIRVSLFVDALPAMVEGAAEAGADRVELYTESYAAQFGSNRNLAIAPYVLAAERAMQLGIGLNAGHDLNKENLGFFAANIPGLLEVSIGHALVCDALYLGLENTIMVYKRCLHKLT